MVLEPSGFFVNINECGRINWIDLIDFGILDFRNINETSLIIIKNS